MPLTDIVVQKAEASSKPYRVKDECGLFLEVSVGRSGLTRKWWRFRYHFQGKANMLSLGIYPLVSLEEARTRRDKARGLLARGIDPSAERKAQKAGEGAERLERLAREAAERKEALSQSKIKVVSHLDGMVELWKGRNMLRFAPAEAHQVCVLLTAFIKGADACR